MRGGENAECDNCGGPLDAPREQSAVQAGVLRDLDVEVCQFCSDIECDGVACIAALDPDDVSDHPKIERLHTMLATANGLSAAMHRDTGLAAAAELRELRDIVAGVFDLIAARLEAGDIMFGGRP